MANQVAAVALAVLALSQPANAFTTELRWLEEAIERIGTKVIWINKHEICRPGLFGAYVPAKDIVFICQGNHQLNYAELVGTLKHEGWHAVQAKCNDGRQAISDKKIRRALQNRDRPVLHKYHPKQQRAEAEARVVEQFPTPNWLRGVRAYCYHRYG